MSNIPTIRASAQARLLIYRLFLGKLNEAEKLLLEAGPARWESLLNTLMKEIESSLILKVEHVVLSQAFDHINRASIDGLQRQMSRLTGKSLWIGKHPTALLESFVSEHVQLIKSVQREHLDKISLALNRGIREGRLQKELENDIRRSTGISKRRASLIARTAPLQYSGEITRQNQMNAGIKQYRWQTSNDERVRVSHRKRDDEVYAWDGPGPHPRSEVNCRCDAVPVLD